MVRHLIACAVLVAASLVSAVHAEILTGTYSGYYEYESFMDYTRYPNTPAAGSVTIDTSYFSRTAGDDTSFVEYYLFSLDTSVQAMSFTRDDENGHWSSAGGGQMIRLAHEEGFDTLYFGAYFPGGGFGSSIKLVGAPGSLFTELSLDAIVTGALQLDRSRSRDYVGNLSREEAELGSVYRFDTFNLSQSPAAVPELSSFFTMILGLGVLAVARRKVR